MWTIEFNGPKGWEVCWEKEEGATSLYAAVGEFMQRISDDPEVAYRLTSPEVSA